MRAGGAVASLGLAGVAVPVAVLASSGVTVLGVAVMTVLLLVGTVVTAHALARAVFPGWFERGRRRPVVATVDAAPAAPRELDEVTVHAEVVEEPPRQITAQRAAEAAWAEQRLYGRP